MNKKLYFRQLIRQYKPFLLLSFFLSMAEPMILLTQKQALLEEAKARLSMGNMDLFNPIHTLTYLTVISCVLAVIIPFIVFHFLYKKADLDNYYSMPVKRESLFRAHFWFGWGVLVALPLLLSVLFRYGILYSYLHALLPNGLGFTAVFVRILILILGSLVLYLFTCLSVFCTTNLFNGLIYAGAIHTFFPFLTFLIEQVSKSRVGYLSPMESAGLKAYELINFISGYASYLNDKDGGLVLPVIIFWFFLAIPLFFLVQKLFADRRAERVNASFMYRRFYPAVIGIYGVTFLTQLLTSALITKIHQIEGVYSTYNHYGMATEILQIFLTGLILYFIVQLVRYHGKPPLVKKLGVYLVLFALSFAFASGLTGPVRRHISLKQPVPSKVKWVMVRNVSSDTSQFLYYLDHPDEYDPANFEGNAEMKEIYKLRPDDPDPRPKSIDQYILPEKHLGAPVPSTEVGQTIRYEEALFSEEEVKKTIMDLEKETIQNIMNGKAKEFLVEIPCQPGDVRSYDGPFIEMDASKREDGKCYTSRQIIIQLIYLDKDKKVLMEKELPVFKADRQKVRQLMNDKLFDTKGVLVKAGDR